VEALVAHGVDVDIVLADTPERPLVRPHGLAHDPVRLGEALADLSEAAKEGRENV
jgi:hypothetical protein